MKYRYKGYTIEIRRRETGSHEYVLSKRGRQLERAYTSAFPGYTAEQALAAAKRRVDKKTAKKKPATQQRLPRMEVFDVEAVERKIKKLPLKMRVQIFPAARKLADRLEQPPVIVRREMEKLGIVEPMGQGFWGLSKLGTRYYVAHRRRLEDALAKEFGFKLEKKPKPNKNKNPIRKKGVFPKYTLQAKGGRETVWQYRGWTIYIYQRTTTEFAWKADHPDMELWSPDRALSGVSLSATIRKGKKPVMEKHSYWDPGTGDPEMTGPTGETEQDALWIAKYYVDKYELYYALYKKNAANAGLLLRAIDMLESQADKIVVRREEPTRARLARLWEKLNPKHVQLSGKGAQAWQYFQTLPSSERLTIMDDVVEFARRASWWEIRTTAKNPKSDKKAKKNPDSKAKRQKGIAAGFLLGMR